MLILSISACHDGIVNRANAISGEVLITFKYEHQRIAKRKSLHKYVDCLVELQIPVFQPTSS